MDQQNPHKRKGTHTKLDNRRKKKAKSTRCIGCLSRTCASKNNCGMFISLIVVVVVVILKLFLQLPFELHQNCYVESMFFSFQISSQYAAAA